MLIFKLKEQPYSLRRNLRLLVAVCVLPAALVSATLIYSTYTVRRTQIDQETGLQARAVMADLEREISTIESVLKVLATAPELANGDLASFHQRASLALAPGIAYNFIVMDPQGRQLVNTLRPYGSPLPSAGAPAGFDRVFTQRATVLTDLFVGPVVKRYAIALSVPVVVDDKVVYSLSIGLDPGRISALTMRQGLREGWLVAVLDSSGTIVGRSRDADRFTGEKAVAEVLGLLKSGGDGNMLSNTKDGIPVYSAYTTSNRWRWQVVVGAPQSVLTGDVLRSLSTILIGILTALGLGLWLARRITRRVLKAVHQLNHAAVLAGRGEDAPQPLIQLEETQAVGEAIVQAAQAVRQLRFQAQHDALTGLPNRLMFEEVAEHSLSYARRKSQGLAILALDLDGFKAVNDTLGHSKGDQVLTIAAKRIGEAIRGADVAARIGGDEFIVLLTDVNGDTALETAHRIIALVSQPYPDVPVRVSTSIGIALYPMQGTVLGALVTAADAALYRAKRDGKGCAVFA